MADLIITIIIPNCPSTIHVTGQELHFCRWPLRSAKRKTVEEETTSELVVVVVVVE
jgi:hypothetical protein